MSRRTLLLIFAIVLGVAGILLSLPRSSKVVQREVIVATEDIDTYTVLDEGMVEHRTLLATQAADAYATTTTPLMTTRPIRKGEPIQRANALPLDTFRPGFPQEVISFPATVDKMVSGQVLPGHKINIYGYRPEQGERSGELILVAPKVWVVDVRTAQGEASKAASARTGDSEGLLTGLGLTRAPASIVTVAGNRQIVMAIIEALGRSGLSAWVTLAPDEVPPPPQTTLRVDAPPVGVGKYTARWVASPRATNYVLEEASTAAFTNTTTVYSGAATAVTLAERKAGVYYYRVIATNIIGKSPWSNTVSVKVEVPQAPELARISNPKGSGNYTLKWSTPKGAAGYVVEEAITPTFEAATEVYSGTSNTTSLSGREFGLYYYRVKATSEVGDSAWSNAESTNVPTPTPVPPTPIPPTPIPPAQPPPPAACVGFTKLSDGPRPDLKNRMPPWYLLVKVVDAQGKVRTMEDDLRVDYCCPQPKPDESVYKAGQFMRVKHEEGKEGYVEFPLAQGAYKVDLYVCGSRVPLATLTLSDDNPIWEVVLLKQ
jgi:hypothetical protein